MSGRQRQASTPPTRRSNAPAFSADALEEDHFDEEGQVVFAYEVRAERRGGRGTATISAILGAAERQ